MKRFLTITKNILLKIILGTILTVPNAILRRLSHKKELIEWNFVYANGGFYKITDMGKSRDTGGYDLYLSIKPKGEINDDLLIASFIMFLKAYFYACDTRQKNIVAQTLKELAESQSINSWSHLLYTRVVERALSEQEQKYVTEIFTKGHYDANLPYGIPPFRYKRGKYNGSRLFRADKYNFYITKSDNIILDHFFMTIGRDVVLLPITIGMMQKAIADLISETGKKTLYKSILNFLAGYNSNLSSIELLDLANKVLVENKVTQLDMVSANGLGRNVDPNVVSEVTKETAEWARKTGCCPLAMEDIDDCPPFTRAYQKMWTDTANYTASSIAKNEGLTGQELVDRATEIFNDARRFEPQTNEGEKVRMMAQLST